MELEDSQKGNHTINDEKQNCKNTENNESMIDITIDSDSNSDLISSNDESSMIFSRITIDDSKNRYETVSIHIGTYCFSKDSSIAILDNQLVLFLQCDKNGLSLPYEHVRRFNLCQINKTKHVFMQVEFDTKALNAINDFIKSHLNLQENPKAKFDPLSINEFEKLFLVQLKNSLELPEFTNLKQKLEDCLQEKFSQEASIYKIFQTQRTYHEQQLFADNITQISKEVEPDAQKLNTKDCPIDCVTNSTRCDEIAIVKHNAIDSTNNLSNNCIKSPMISNSKKQKHDESDEICISEVRMSSSSSDALNQKKKDIKRIKKCDQTTLTLTKDTQSEVNAQSLSSCETSPQIDDQTIVKNVQHDFTTMMANPIVNFSIINKKDTSRNCSLSLIANQPASLSFSITPEIKLDIKIVDSQNSD